MPSEPDSITNPPGQSWYWAGRLGENPATIGDLDALLDGEGPRFELDGALWCRCCQRAYPVRELRVVKCGPGWSYYEWALECAVTGCTGRRADWHPWHPDELPRALHPEYPAWPVPFNEYPLQAPHR